MNQPACENHATPDLFFSDHPGDIVRAKKVCATCPIVTRNGCLRFALELNEQHGVWGGFTREERLHVRGAA